MKKTLRLAAAGALMLSSLAYGDADGGKGGAAEGKGAVLVAYFSWSPQENTKAMAEYVAEFTGGELFRIQPKTPYTSNYNKVIDDAQNERRKKARPELLQNISAEQAAKYDVIFIGYPVWWYDAPMIIYSFLEANDFSGKKIVTFATSGGSGISDGALRSSIKADFTSGLCMAHFSAGNSARSRVESWITRLGYHK